MYSMTTQALRLQDNCFFYVLQAILESRMEAEPEPKKAIDPIDAACICQIKAGRPDLIELLVRKHSDRLYHIILRMVQSPAAAEDLLQDTWVLVMRNLHKFDTAYPLLPWLTQIAVNACRSYWRKEKPKSLLKPAKISERISPSSSDLASDISREVEVKKLAQEALKGLSPRLREIVVLKFYSGLTYEEVAEALKIPIGTAKSRLNFALMKMRDFIQEGKKR
jgi:RNA polymerase sigma-70 factor (ECF subfamily)